MWPPMPISHPESTPHPAMLPTHIIPASIIAPAISHPLHPFPTTKMTPKVPPQSLLILRMVILSEQIVAPHK